MHKSLYPLGSFSDSVIIGSRKLTIIFVTFPH